MPRSRTVDLCWNALFNDFRRSGLTHGALSAVTAFPQARRQRLPPNGKKAAGAVGLAKQRLLTSFSKPSHWQRPQTSESAGFPAFGRAALPETLSGTGLVAAKSIDRAIDLKTWCRPNWRLSVAERTRSLGRLPRWPR